MKAFVNGIEIAYEDGGSGSPVVLLTGLGGAGRAWGDHPIRFAGSYRTIVPDHRGTGGSSALEGVYTIEAHAADMAELLRHLDTGPAHIIGSSTGGAIGQVMALDHVDVVRSLTLVSSWAGPDPYFQREFQLRRQILTELGAQAYLEASAVFLYAPSFTSGSPSAVDAWIERAGRGGTPSSIMAARIDMILAHDQRHRLREIRVPTLVVVGDQDICTPPHLSRELAAAIPDAELTVLGGGHLIYDERPDEFFTTVVEFLRRHRVPGS